MLEAERDLNDPETRTVDFNALREAKDENNILPKIRGAQISRPNMKIQYSTEASREKVK